MAAITGITEPWNNHTYGEVETFFKEKISDIIIGDFEHVIVNVSSEDGLLDVSNISVTVKIGEDSAGTIYNTDVSGNCSFNIPANSVYTVSVGTQEGYQRMATRKYFSQTNNKKIYFVFVRGNADPSTIYVTCLNADTMTPMTQTEGKFVQLTFDGEQSILKEIDSNGVAMFDNVPYGKHGYIYAPKLPNSITPEAREITVLNETINISLLYRTSNIGIFMTRADGTDIDYRFWESGDTCIAIHINTQNLANKGADFYIKPEDLYNPSVNKQWCLSNIPFPNVPYDSSTDWDGANNTQKMLEDAETLVTHSPAAEYVTAQRFLIKGNNSIGFLGTKNQWNEVLVNYESIYAMLTLLGYTPSFRSKYIWTSTQYSAQGAWLWNGGTWNVNTKDRTYAVVPFFAN